MSANSCPKCLPALSPDPAALTRALALQSFLHHSPVQRATRGSRGTACPHLNHPAAARSLRAAPSSPGCASQSRSSPRAAQQRLASSQRRGTMQWMQRLLGASPGAKYEPVAATELVAAGIPASAASCALVRRPTKGGVRLLPAAALLLEGVLTRCRCCRCWPPAAVRQGHDVLSMHLSSRVGAQVRCRATRAPHQQRTLAVARLLTCCVPRVLPGAQGCAWRRKG